MSDTVLVKLSCNDFLRYIYIYIYKGAQAIGMGQEAQSVAEAADLYTKANHILGYMFPLLVTNYSFLFFFI